VGKEGDPASPVVGVADDSPALLASGGRRRTRPLRGLKQLRRKAPPNAALLGGSEGALSRHRGFTEAPCAINEHDHPARLSEMAAFVAMPDHGLSGYAALTRPALTILPKEGRCRHLCQTANYGRHQKTGTIQVGK